MSTVTLKLLGPSDVGLMFELHGGCFDVPWTLPAFETLMALPTTLVLGLFTSEEGEVPPEAANQNFPPKTSSGFFVGFLMVSTTKSQL